MRSGARVAAGGRVRGNGFTSSLPGHPAILLKPWFVRPACADGPPGAGGIAGLAAPMRRTATSYR